MLSKVLNLNNSVFFIRVKPLQSLFNGVVKMSANMSLGFVNEQKCLLQPDSHSGCDIDLDENYFNRKTNILGDLLQLGANEDLSPYTRLAVEEENELSSSTRQISDSSNNASAGKRTEIDR